MTQRRSSLVRGRAGGGAALGPGGHGGPGCRGPLRALAGGRALRVTGQVPGICAIAGGRPPLGRLLQALASGARWPGPQRSRVIGRGNRIAVLLIMQRARFCDPVTRRPGQVLRQLQQIPRAGRQRRQRRRLLGHVLHRDAVVRVGPLSPRSRTGGRARRRTPGRTRRRTLGRARSRRGCLIRGRAVRHRRRILRDRVASHRRAVRHRVAGELQRDLPPIDAAEEQLRLPPDVFRGQHLAARGSGQLHRGRRLTRPGGHLPQHPLDHGPAGHRRVHDDGQAAARPLRQERHEAGRQLPLVDDDAALDRHHVHIAGQVILHPREELRGRLAIGRGEIQRQVPADAVEEPARDPLDPGRAQRLAGTGQPYLDRPLPPPGGHLLQHLLDHGPAGHRRVHDDNPAAAGPRRQGRHGAGRRLSPVDDDAAPGRPHVHALGQVTLDPRGELLGGLVIRRARGILGPGLRIGLRAPMAGSDRHRIVGRARRLNRGRARRLNRGHARHVNRGRARHVNRGRRLNRGRAGRLTSGRGRARRGGLMRRRAVLRSRRILRDRVAAHRRPAHRRMAGQLHRELPVDAVEEPARDPLDLFRAQRLAAGGTGQLYLDRPLQPAWRHIPQQLADYYFLVFNRRVHDDFQAAVGPRLQERHEVGRRLSLVDDDAPIDQLHARTGQITLHPRDEPRAPLLIRRALGIPGRGLRVRGRPRTSGGG